MAIRAKTDLASSARAELGQDANAASVILDAAQRLFVEGGYEGVSLEQVGRAAGVTRQTVYNRFGSKDAVFRAMIDRHWQAVKAEAKACFSDELDDVTDPAEVLRGYARALARFVTETDQVTFTRLVVAESRRQPWIAEEFYQVGKAPLVEAFAHCLTRMTQRKLLCCPDPVLAALQFMGIVQEFIIWPHVMAIGPALAQLPSHAVAIDEAVAMFLARYQQLARTAASTPRRNKTLG